ncbi:Guanine nucleotide-binding protein alpha-2 subunit [Entophlyctis luteolus]|nr:Guanine nucleotide-binding protein alpha-2 subunit [Entophlyctis luteolus]
MGKSAQSSCEPADLRSKRNRTMGRRIDFRHVQYKKNARKRGGGAHSHHMGNQCGGPEDPEAAEAKSRSRKIDAILKDDHAVVQKFLHDRKVLLLGTGDSGKTTVLKQIRLSYGAGFTDIEVVEFRSALLMNAIMCGKFLVYAMKSLKIPYGSDAAELPNNSETTPNADADPVDTLSSDALANRTGDSELPASAARIRDMNNIYGFTKNDFIPTELVEDLLVVWNDPGVKVLITPPLLNPMVDSLNVFTSVLNMKLFARTGIVLFMNKMDVFKEKLDRSKISDYFPDFKGREIHIHLTLAIDSTQLNDVMRAVFYLIFMWAALFLLSSK